ncbi:MAG: VOC family protein [Ancalomicrobiaceae bacterium]|nr:VOC family protein [Ancalomicrobiaceae bacterium]
MAVVGLNHVNFQGPKARLDALRDFYCDVLGLAEGPRPPFRMFGYWLYAGGQPIVHLYETEPGDDRRLDIRGTFDHIAFSCVNADEVEARLAALGISHRVASPPGTQIKQIFLHDPAGTLVELQFGDR